MEMLGYRAGDEGVRQAVKAVLAEFVLFGDFLIDCVSVDGFRDLLGVSGQNRGLI